ncbi:hypothetical protein [Bradyrhizobium sp. ORS 86]
MVFTTLDPITALIVVDLQNGVLGLFLARRLGQFHGGNAPEQS